MSKVKTNTFHEEIVYLPWFGDIHVHIDDNNEPLRIYVYVDELKKASVGFEYLDDKDEKILCNPKNYIKGKNPLFVHLKKKYVKSVFDWLMIG